MKIGYLTDYDPLDLNAWSGLGFYIRKCLENSGHQILDLGPLRDQYQVRTKLKKLMYKNFYGKQYIRNLDPIISDSHASQANKAIQENRKSFDVVFTTNSTLLSSLKTSKPKVFWSDATFAGMKNFYPGFTNLCDETIKSGNRLEQRALDNCDLAIYSSDWAACTAISNYDLDPKKVIVVPFGANIDCNRSKNDINNLVLNKSLSHCNLLFIGVDWHRKGGPLAVKVAESLNKMGMPTTLHVVGCKLASSLPNFVINHGFISKKSQLGREYLEKLFSTAHFFILPSKAECYGVVFAEASSFGLPILSTNIGGIPTAVQDNKNGWLFNEYDSVSKYVHKIKSVMSSQSLLQHYSLSSFNEYLERLNWSIAGSNVTTAIKQLMA